jgi:hypothetical protein
MIGIGDQQLNLEINKNPFPNITFGDWGNNTLKIELDNCFSKREVINIAHMLNNRYNLDGFIILKSSDNIHKIWNTETNIEEKVVYKYKTTNYHIVFNRKIKSVSELHSIIAWLCLQTKDWNLIMWFLLQCIKQTLTLRMGFKGKKKPPEIIYRYGKQDKMIKEFEDNQNFILESLEKMNN